MRGDDSARGARESADGSLPCEPRTGYDFEMSIVPDTQEFFPPKCPPIATASTAITSRSEKGVYSYDPILDENPNELWRYFMSNLQKPQLAVRLCGTHTELRVRSVANTEGEGSHEESYTESITDFNFQIDLSNCVSSEWSRIVSHPFSNRGRLEAPTVRETIEEYTRSKNSFKEFRFSKTVLWDFDELSRWLVDVVCATGYSGNIEISYTAQDYKVCAFASNNWSRAAHSMCGRFLCYITCLWIVFVPTWLITRKRMKDRLVCEYPMALDVDEFYSRNRYMIHSAVLERCQGCPMVAQ